MLIFGSLTDSGCSHNILLTVQNGGTVCREILPDKTHESHMKWPS